MAIDHAPGPRVVHCACGWRAPAAGFDEAWALLVGHAEQGCDVDDILILCATCAQPGGKHWTPPHIGRQPPIPGLDDALAERALERRAT